MVYEGKGTDTLPSRKLARRNAETGHIEQPIGKVGGPAALLLDLLLILITNRKSARVDNATLLARIAHVQQICQDNHCQVQQMLEQQRLKNDNHARERNDQFDYIQAQLGKSEKTSSTIMSRASDTLQCILEIKQLIVSMSQTITQRQISASNSNCIRTLDPTKELPVMLEDALGRHLEIPAQWLDTLQWNVCALPCNWPFEKTVCFGPNLGFF